MNVPPTATLDAGRNRAYYGRAVGRHLARRTMRVRLTLLYGVLFLLSGSALVAITFVLFQRATEYTPPRLPTVPHAPAIRDLQRPIGPGITAAARTLPQLAKVQYQLARDQHMLSLSLPGAARRGGLPAPIPYQVARDQRELARDQRQLAGAVRELAGAVHRIARAGSVEAAQRAADSHQLLLDSGIALAIVAVLALLSAWLVAGRMLRPIRTITRKAQQISSTSLKERLALPGPPDELKELGDTLDDLFERLDAAFEAQRQFVSNASHELRAPLTRQRALIQVALADPLASSSSLRAAHERVLASEQHLEQIIAGLLTLTRGRAGLERSEQVDLAAVASEVAIARESQLAASELEIRTRLDTAPTAGDPRLIERLIANLLDNAIRHNCPGGHVEMTTGTRGRRAFVSIANTGPSVALDEIPRLLEPFERLGRRTGHHDGHGLGLSIVQAIATAHHAELSARPRPEGGLAVEVSFPPSMRCAASAGPALLLAESP